MQDTQTMKYTLTATYLTAYVGTVRFQLQPFFFKPMSITQIRFEVEKHANIMYANAKIRYIPRSGTLKFRYTERPVTHQRSRTGLEGPVLWSRDWSPWRWSFYSIYLESSDTR